MNNYPMYRNNVNMPYNNMTYNKAHYNNDRLIGGGFLAPFVLGGITGGLLAPAFYGPGRPCCGPYPAPYPAPYPVPTPYPYYGPYYR